MLNISYTTDTARQNLDACTKLMHKLMRKLGVSHPDWEIIPSAIVKDAMLLDNGYVFDKTPVVQYHVYKDDECIFDILPLLNAHATDNDSDEWCIEGYYYLEDRDIIVFYEDYDFDACFEELEEYLAD